MLEVGTKAPNFNLQNQDGIETTLSNYAGKWIVIYFYPKDDTPGCTTEACEFSFELAGFRDMDAVVLGVSADSVARHEKFANKHSLGVTLLSDPQHAMIESYGAWREKMMCGKKYMGIVRSSYIIDPSGKIAKAYDNVKAKGHAQKVKEDLLKLRNA